VRAVYQCNRCHHQHSLISGTIFSATKLPLTLWFLAIHLITQAKTGISALSLRRQLGVSYNTAWSIKQKLMQVMKERDDSKPLSGIIQLDDVYWGGEQRGGKRGRGSANKTPFVAAVSVNEKGHPMAMNMTVVNGFRSKEIAPSGPNAILAPIASWFRTDWLALPLLPKQDASTSASSPVAALKVFHWKPLLGSIP
jgi:hypothetical protein